MEEEGETQEVPAVDPVSAQAPASTGPIRPKKTPLTRVLPSDRLTADRQIDALRAFAAVAETNAGKPVTNEAAGEAIKMAAATIIVTNAFFCDIGLLTRAEGGFIVAPEAIAFFRTQDGLSPETAPEKLLPVFEKQWFTQVLSARLKLAPMDISSVVKAIGEASGASKEHLNRIGVLIDLLCFVRWIGKEGNQVRLLTSARSPVVPEKGDTKPASSEGKGDEEPGEGIEKCSLTLDPKTKRKFVIYAPTTVTAKELARIKMWLESQLIVEDEPNQ